MRMIIVVAIAALWEVLPRIGVLDPVFIPPVSRIVDTIIQQMRYGELLHHAALSTQRALGGLAFAIVIGPLLGLLVGGAFPRSAIVLEPVIQLLSQANPVVLFHVILLFLGIGESAKVFIIAWLCTWPIMFSAISGIEQADPDVIRLAQSFGLKGLRLFWRVLLPAATPSILTGIRLSGGYAFVMLVAAEMMGASSGLGWFVVQSQESYHAARIFSGAIVITALALLLDGVLKRAESWLIRWRPSYDERRVLIEDLATASVQ
jgi:NitT/TauT family transport system permease protein